MPDHAHFAIHVTSELERPLGDYTGAIKGRATGTRVIMLINEPMGERFKPGGK